MSTSAQQNSSATAGRVPHSHRPVMSRVRSGGRDGLRQRLAALGYEDLEAPVGAALREYRRRFLEELPRERRADVKFTSPAISCAAVLLVAKKQRRRVDKTAVLREWGASLSEAQEFGRTMLRLMPQLAVAKEPGVKREGAGVERKGVAGPSRGRDGRGGGVTLDGEGPSISGQVQVVAGEQGEAGPGESGAGWEGAALAAVPVGMKRGRQESRDLAGGAEKHGAKKVKEASSEEQLRALILAV